MNTWDLVKSSVTIAGSTSLMACRMGIPFGSIPSWTLVVIMSNDSGQYPYTPLILAVFGYPVVILCDIVLFIPALFILFSMWYGNTNIRRNQ
jgi:hypothetical protein